MLLVMYDDEERIHVDDEKTARMGKRERVWVDEGT
jgi:hypothetical protein